MCIFAQTNVNDMKKILYVIAAAMVLLASGCGKEVVDPAMPNVTWTSNPNFGTVELVQSLDAAVTVSAPSKFQDLQLVLGLGKYNILANRFISISNNLGGNANPKLDLIADPDCVSFAKALGMNSVGPSLKNSTEVKLDLKAILEKILEGNERVVENNTTFSMEIRVTGQNGKTISRAARIHFTSAPSITWEKNESFGEILLDPADKKDCKIKLWVPGKIDKLTVKLESNADPAVTSFVKNRTADGSTTMDLVNDTGISGSISGFPAASSVSGKDQVTLDFAFMYDRYPDMSGASLNVFTLTAVDKNGKEDTKQVRFRKN